MRKLNLNLRSTQRYVVFSCYSKSHFIQISVNTLLWFCKTLILFNKISIYKTMEVGILSKPIFIYQLKGI